LKHHANPHFWACYRALSPEVQQVADRAYEHLKKDPRHPSLNSRRSVDIGQHASVLATERLPPRRLTALFGSGLERMPTMTSCSANALLTVAKLAPRASLGATKRGR